MSWTAACTPAGHPSRQAGRIAPRSARSRGSSPALVWLAELGDREEALAAIDEDVTFYRQLAQTRPEAFLPHLAMSVNNQSNRLGSKRVQDNWSKASRLLGEIDSGLDE